MNTEPIQPDSISLDRLRQGAQRAAEIGALDARQFVKAAENHENFGKTFTDVEAFVDAVNSVTTEAQQAGWVGESSSGNSAYCPVNDYTFGQESWLSPDGTLRLSVTCVERGSFDDETWTGKVVEIDLEVTE